ERQLLAGEWGDGEDVHDQAAQARVSGERRQRHAVVAGGVGQHAVIPEAPGSGDDDGVEAILEGGGRGAVLQLQPDRRTVRGWTAQLDQRSAALADADDVRRIIDWEQRAIVPHATAGSTVAQRLQRAAVQTTQVILDAQEPLRSALLAAWTAHHKRREG